MNAYCVDNQLFMSPNDICSNYEIIMGVTLSRRNKNKNNLYIDKIKSKSWFMSVIEKQYMFMEFII